VRGRHEDIAPAPARHKPGSPRAFLELARPRQWAKNVLVLAAPGAGGVLLERAAVLSAALAFVSLCLAASGLYYLNDAKDAEADRRHPKKRRRPVARGAVEPRLACTCGAGLVAAGLLAAIPLGLPSICVLLAYVASTTAYTLRLKDERGIELLVVAFGFVLRALLGATATDVVPSTWFVLVALFGSLFVIAGKRLAEFLELGDTRGGHRRTLLHYDEHVLRQFVTMSSTALVLTYCLWAFEMGTLADHPIVHQVTIAPMLVVVFRYLGLVSSGGGGEPERALLADPVTVTAAAAWTVLLFVAVYG
jgi:decaprenyl-phosphate phosphoribosyltransferase